MTFALINPENYYQFITMHGMIMVIYLLTALFLGGFGNYLIPLMLRLAGHGVPVHEHAQLLGLPAVGHHTAGQLLRAGRRDRCAGWTLISTAGDRAGHAGYRLGHPPDAGSLAVFIVAFTMGGLNYVTTVLQARCRGMTLMRMPLSIWGIFMATILGLLAFPGTAGQRHHDDPGQNADRHQFLHAGDGVHGPEKILSHSRGWQPDPVPAPVLVLRSSRGVHRCAAGVRHRLGPAGHATRARISSATA